MILDNKATDHLLVSLFLISVYHESTSKKRNLIKSERKMFK